MHHYPLSFASPMVVVMVMVMVVMMMMMMMDGWMASCFNVLTLNLQLDISWLLRLPLASGTRPMSERRRPRPQCGYFSIVSCPGLSLPAGLLVVISVYWRTPGASWASIMGYHSCPPPSLPPTPPLLPHSRVDRCLGFMERVRFWWDTPAGGGYW